MAGEARADVILGFAVALHHDLATVRGRYLHVDHVDLLHLVEDLAWGQSARLAPGQVLQRRLKAVDIMGTILLKPYQDLGEGLFFDN